jgi:hypothetical protein
MSGNRVIDILTGTLCGFVIGFTLGMAIYNKPIPRMVTEITKHLCYKHDGVGTFRRSYGNSENWFIKCGDSAVFMDISIKYGLEKEIKEEK